jgi:hypothetical protein
MNLPLGPVCECVERLWLRVTHGQQPVARKNEADRLALRLRRFCFRQDERRHEDPVVFLVQAARDFDLVHVVLCRRFHADKVLDRFSLLHGRFHQVDPDGIRRNDDWIVGFAHARQIAAQAVFTLAK